MKNSLVAQSFALFTFFVGATFTLVSINEIVSRKDLADMLQISISEVLQRDAELKLDDTLCPVVDGADQSFVAALEHLQFKLQALATIGTASNEDVAIKIRKRYFDLVGCLYHIKSMSTHPLTEEPPEDTPHGRHFFSTLGDYYFQINSSYLLAVVLVLAASIGSMATWLRTDSAPLGSSIALGGCSGFIIYLALQGGEQIFMFEAYAGFNQFNPYTCSLLAFLGGAFSDRTFDFLKSLTERFIQKSE